MRRRRDRSISVAHRGERAPGEWVKSVVGGQPVGLAGASRHAVSVTGDRTRGYGRGCELSALRGESVLNGKEGCEP